jgi:putative Holliday junction resolvase
MPEVDPRAARRGSRTLLAFDFGRRRIGVAIGEGGVGTAGPLPAVRGDCPGPDWSAILALVETWQPHLMLVGRPASLDGEPTWMTELAIGFAHELGRRSGIPVEMVDERLTSRAASSDFAEQRRSGLRRRRARPGEIDSAAAQLMLRSWLDEHGRTRSG